MALSPVVPPALALPRTVKVQESQGKTSLCRYSLNTHFSAVTNMVPSPSGKACLKVTWSVWLAGGLWEHVDFHGRRGPPLSFPFCSAL